MMDNGMASAPFKLSYPSISKEGLKNKYLSMDICRTLDSIISVDVAKRALANNYE